MCHYLCMEDKEKNQHYCSSSNSSCHGKGEMPHSHCNFNTLILSILFVTQGDDEDKGIFGSIKEER